MLLAIQLSKRKSTRSNWTPSPFARVRRLVNAIPRGRVATYGQLSQLIGGRLTPVGIGWALRAAGEEVPWHRVINGQGGISTDRHTPGRQRAMLEAEGVKFGPDDTVDLRRYQWRRRPRPW